MQFDTLDDEELAATAFVWRRRALHGDSEAAATAHAMEAELRRRLSDTPSSLMTLEDATEPRRWWKFWQRRA